MISGFLLIRCFSIFSLIGLRTRSGLLIAIESPIVSNSGSKLFTTVANATALISPILLIIHNPNGSPLEAILKKSLCSEFYTTI